jgi:hypothetical protein
VGAQEDEHPLVEIFLKIIDSNEGNKADLLLTNLNNPHSLDNKEEV